MTEQERLRAIGRHRRQGQALREQTAFALPLTPWVAEDYLLQTVSTCEVQDHWLPLSRQLPETPASPLRLPEQTPNHCPSHLPTGGAASAAAFSSETSNDQLRPFDWFETGAEPESRCGVRADLEARAVDLPFFDPAATAAPRIREVFSRPHEWRVGTKAGLLALATAIPDAQSRARAARVFQDALEEQRWPGLFKAWLRLAPQVDCPRLLELVFELRASWDDSPGLWRYRSRPGSPSRQHESARAQMSWHRSLALASAAPERAAWQILDEDLLAEWEELSDPCPGFWSFAEFLNLQICGGEERLFAAGQIMRESRFRRALHLQDSCAHLGMGRSGAAWPDSASPIIDAETAHWQHRAAEFRPGLRSVAVPPRPPTVAEMKEDDRE